MAQWIIIIINLGWLCGVLRGQEIPPPAVQECCQNGRTWGLRGQDCTTLPLISSSPFCRIAQEQCCAAAAGDLLCDGGIKTARGQGACERPFFQGDPWETRISQMCCDCCLLGLMMAGQGSSCELPGLLLGQRCGVAAKSCCSKNATEEPEAADLEPVEKPKSNVTVKLEEAPVDCADANCSQLCVGNGTCACHHGYHLQKDGVTCEDVNECLIGVHTCVIGQACINTEGSFRCQREISCGTGYELRDDNACEDIDECTLGTHNCGPDFLCTNTAGSFRCRPKETCKSGFIQDAIGSCIDINECVVRTNPCLAGEVCINTMGSYSCRRNTVQCGRGYHLTEDGMHCDDIDECHGGGVCGDHSCVNLVGTYRCECRPGYAFNSITKLCEDINECRHYPGRLCAHKCDNTEGSYHCGCATGFKLSQDGRNCEDVNECEDNPCSQECANVFGSYHCYCRRGYQLSDIDGITCEDIDECALPTGGHICSYRCTNTPGNFYCTCPPTGYTLSPNGRTCQDIDECATGSHTCSVSESCFNIQGGFRCLSFDCPANFRQASQGSTQDASTSMRCIKSCPPNDFSCSVDRVHLITHTAVSLPTFRDFSEPKDVIYLRTVTVANTVHSPATTDVFFDILAADDEASFDIQKSSHQGMVMGVVRQVKPITGPGEFALEVAMSYIKSGALTHQNVVIIKVFISEFWF